MNWVEQLKTLSVWKIYSQSNEESYILHMLSRLPIINHYIVELGAWDGYNLSNTRYFTQNYAYKALLIDGDNHGNEEVKQHFITKENILAILEQYQVPDKFDLFCIDLDGNDIYILEKVLSRYKPSLVVAEFNPIFAAGESYAIGYDEKHTWSEDNYYGFSFAAGVKMAEKFGYTCIFQNDNLNMYFVENSKLAISLNVSVADLKGLIPQVPYQVTHYHPKSQKNGWVIY